MTVWCTVFFIRMCMKDVSFRKKDGWEAYKKQSYMLFPKVSDSFIATWYFYTLLIGGIALLYVVGGFQSFIGDIRHLVDTTQYMMLLEQIQNSPDIAKWVGKK